MIEIILLISPHRLDGVEAGGGTGGGDAEGEAEGEGYTEAGGD